MRVIGKIFKWVGYLILLVIVLIGGALLYANTAPGKRQISEFASKKIHRQVVLSGGIAIPLSWPPALRIEKLTIANMEGGKADPMVDIGLLQVAIALPPLWHHKIDLTYIKLYDSTVHLERNADKVANWDFSNGEPAEPKKEDAPFNPPMIGALDVRNSHITYLDVPEKIDVAIEAGTDENDVVISGKGIYKAQNFGLKAKGGSLLTVTENQPYPVDTTLTVGHTTIHAKGTIDDPVHFGGLNISLEVKGDDASNLFPLIGVVLPPTPPYDVAGQLGYDTTKKIWSFDKFKGKLGSSDLSGDLSFDQSRERPKLSAKFVSQRLDFKDLGPLIGTPPEKDKALSAEQKAKIGKAEESPYVIPDVPLDISRLKAMDADVSFTGKSIISPSLPLDDFYLHVVLDDLILKIEPVKFGTASGDVSADLTINARKEPATTGADFTFRRLSLAKLMEGAGKKLGKEHVADGYIGGQARLSGTGKSLRQILSSSNGALGIGMEGGDISNLLIQLAGLDVAQALGFVVTGDKATSIRCVIGDFGVKNGVMKSNALVADTADTNLLAGGTLDFKTEAMNFRLKPEPKNVSIFTLRTPIDITGTLKKPSVSLEKKDLIEKGAVAVAIGVVLTPIASILGFVDAGGGHDSDCAQLVANMKAHTGTNNQTAHVPVNPTHENAPVH